mmetsp:Transcript_41457/g.97209  ORF Transcript_41457/g.97209 Transcript_41457/m.97209 type:complete len:218 (-) Transcript_41457:177-830(-)
MVVGGPVQQEGRVTLGTVVDGDGVEVGGGEVDNLDFGQVVFGKVRHPNVALGNGGFRFLESPVLWSPEVPKVLWSVQQFREYGQNETVASSNSLVALERAQCRQVAVVVPRQSLDGEADLHRLRTCSAAEIADLGDLLEQLLMLQGLLTVDKCKNGAEAINIKVVVGRIRHSSQQLWGATKIVEDDRRRKIGSQLFRDLAAFGMGNVQPLSFADRRW